MVFLTTGGVPSARVDFAPQQQQPQATQEPQILVVTLRGKLGTQELARCTRAIRTAESHGAGYVVLRLEDAGSLGEDLGDVQSLLDRMQGSEVRTVVLLKGHVTQGAANVAVCADKLFMQPGAKFGEITKPEQEVPELLGPEPDAAMAQRFDGLRAAMAGRLEHRKNKLRPDAQKLVMAMVDPRVQLYEATVREGGVERLRVIDAAELSALQASGTPVIAPEKLSRPLVLGAQKAEDYGLSNGTVDGIDQLAEVLAVDRGAVIELQTDWAEHMVGWLELLQPFLLVAGFVLILFEVKTPGVGLPGLLGVVFLALAMFYSYLVGLAEATEILVFFLGLAAIAVEIFVLPGTIIFGAVGFLCLVLSLVLSRQSFVLPGNEVEEGLLLANLLNLTLLFVLVLVVAASLWRVLPMVPWLNRVFLPPPDMSLARAGGGGQSGLGLADAALTALVGRTGIAATVLRPTGAMTIDGERIDVVTEGEFVEPGTTVRVLYVQGTRVVVAAERPDEGAGADPRASERGNVGLVVLLCIVGLALLVAEVTFVSFGIIATLAGAALIGAVFVAFQDSISFGVTMVIVEVIAAPIVLTLSFKLLPKTRFGKAMILSGPTMQTSAAAADASLNGLVHKTGVTLSPLRPAGFARIEGKKIDVVTRGEMLEANCPIVVIEVAGNRVVVASR